MWQCNHPDLQSARTQYHNPLINHMRNHLLAFPTFVLMGIPQAMHPSFTKPWWHTNSPFDGHFAKLPATVQHLFGANADAFDTSFTEWVDQLPGGSAYDTFAKVAYPNQDECVEIPKFPKGIGPSPEEPNVYSDGSLTLPKQVQFGFSAAGVWWPGRMQTSELEKDFMHFFAETKGIELWANLPGQSTSSTRVELLGFCLAMLADVPVHAGIDNSAVVDKGRKIIQQLQQNCGFTPHTPYNLQVDGDLWAIAHSAIKARGPHSVCITKVKGHAKLAECHTKVLKDRKFHNDRADEIADDAHAKLRAPCVLQLGHRYAKRQNNYINFLTQLHNYLVHMYLVVDKIRHSVGFKMNHPSNKHTKVAMPYMPSDNDGKVIIFKANKIQYQKHKERASKPIQGFLGLLARTKVVQVPLGRTGHTWIEIFLLSVACAPNLHTLLYNKTAKATRGIGAQLAAFTQDVRKLLPLILHDHDQPMFNAPKTCYNRLASYGSTTRLQHTRVLFCLHNSGLTHFHAAMASIHTALTNKQLQRLLTGQLSVPNHNFSKRGAFKWAKHVQQLAQTLQHHHDNDIAQWPQHDDNHYLLNRPEILFTCPQGHRRVASQPLFDVSRPSKPVWCASCRHSWGGTKWLCPCGHKWCDCSIHFNHLPQHNRPTKRPRATTQPATTAESNAKRAKLEPATPAVGRLAFTLGTKLASKFAHLQAQDLQHREKRPRQSED
eukprot:12426934-Karenia_brevis.AAC.1